MTRKFVLSFLLVTLAVASAKTYTLTLSQPSVFGGSELQPGHYKLSLENDKVVITNGKQSVESAVKVEQSPSKFSATTIRYSNGEGKYRVQEIRVGGTKMRLVFD